MFGVKINKKNFETTKWAPTPVISAHNSTKKRDYHTSPPQITFGHLLKGLPTHVTPIFFWLALPVGNEGSWIPTQRPCIAASFIPSFSSKGQPVFSQLCLRYHAPMPCFNTKNLFGSPVQGHQCMLATSSVTSTSRAVIEKNNRIRIPWVMEACLMTGSLFHGLFSNPGI